MVRLFFTYLVLLVLPALAYVAWHRLQTRRVETGKSEEPPPPLAEGPWLVLAAIGVGLAVVSAVVLLILHDGGSPASTYEPPRLEDGKVVPGRLR